MQIDRSSEDQNICLADALTMIGYYIQTLQNKDSNPSKTTLDKVASLARATIDACTDFPKQRHVNQVLDFIKSFK